jgi:hypothetical protein
MQIGLCKFYSTARNREQKPYENLGQSISLTLAHSHAACDELIAGAQEVLCEC